jgi:hypothetical protein
MQKECTTMKYSEMVDLYGEMEAAMLWPHAGPSELAEARVEEDLADWLEAGGEDPNAEWQRTQEANEIANHQFWCMIDDWIDERIANLANA